MRMRHLRRTNAEMMLQLSKLREYAVINENLKGLLALKDSSKYPLNSRNNNFKIINKITRHSNSKCWKKSICKSWNAGNY